jgi:hypothetical protein
MLERFTALWLFNTAHVAKSREHGQWHLGWEADLLRKNSEFPRCTKEDRFCLVSGLER